MKISILEATSNKVLDQQETNWLELKQLLSVHERHELKPGENSDDAKRRITMFSPCEFEVGKPRSNDTAIQLHFGVIDCDDISVEQLESIKRKLSLYNYICYTTWKHTKAKEMAGQFRLRFVFPFSRPVSKNYWPKVWARLNVFFEGMLDSACKDAQRGYYLPAALDPKDHWSKSNTGLVFDVDKLMALRDSELKADKITSKDLQELAERLSKKRGEFHKEFSDSLMRASQGLSFADQGERDTRIFQIANTIAQEFETFDSAQVAELFHKSFEAMQDAGSRKSTKDNLIAKLERAKEKVKQDKERAREELEQAVRARIKQAFGEKRARDWAYTPEELSSFADTAGCSLESFSKRWIIQNENTFYVFFDGKYLGPIGERSLVNTCDLYLSPAISAGVDTTKEGAKGAVLQKTKEELTKQYGTPALHTLASLSAQHSSYDDQTLTFTEATCPLRVTESRHDPEVARFIELLGGADKGRLIDFISVITDTSRPCAALYLHSPPGYGKNVLVSGLARLWTTKSPTTLSTSMSSFNDAISRCPLVVADETMPENFRKNGNSGEWRAFIQATQRSVRRIYCPATDLDGSIRLIMTANNNEMLGTKEDLAQNDLDAILERVCYVDCNNPEVKTFLGERGWEEVGDMIKSDRIAMHALWLRDNHVILEKSRFLLSSKNTSFHRALASGQGLASVLNHWLVSYLQSPNLIDIGSPCAGMIRIKDGEFLVTTKAINDSWATYDTHTNPPTPSKISKALVRICLKDSKRTLRLKGTSLKYWIVDPEMIINWAEENAYSSREEIEAALKKDTVIRELPEKEDKHFNSLLGKQGGIA